MKTLTIGFVARYLGIAQGTVRVLVSKGQLQAVRDRRGWRHFTIEEVNRFKNERDTFYKEGAEKFGFGKPAIRK
jgi:excisionase family DNA binding protein